MHNHNNLRRKTRGKRENYLDFSDMKGKVIKTGPWTEQEDFMVSKLVEKYGPQKWTYIAEHLPGRIGKQCRERWHNHLNPNIRKDSWDTQEEWVLYLLHRLLGNRWAIITKTLKGRTDNSIKNHWNSSMKKKIQEYSKLFMQKIEDYGHFDPNHYCEDVIQCTEVVRKKRGRRCFQEVADNSSIVCPSGFKQILQESLSYYENTVDKENQDQTNLVKTPQSLVKTIRRPLSVSQNLSNFPLKGDTEYKFLMDSPLQFTPQGISDYAYLQQSSAKKGPYRLKNINDSQTIFQESISNIGTPIQLKSPFSVGWRSQDSPDFWAEMLKQDSL